MTDITAALIEEYGIVMPTTDIDMDMPKEGQFIVSQLDDMIASGEYAGPTKSAYDVLMEIADKIEHGHIADDARKPVADIVRYLAQFTSKRQIPLA